MINLVSTLIKFPSVTSDLSTNLSLVQWCHTFLDHRGIQSTILTHSNQPLLAWGCPINHCTLLINSHLDVVPAPDNLFIPHRKSNRLFGRGAADTKSAVAALLSLPHQTIALAASKQILFSLSTDEETGGSSTKDFISSLSHLKFGLFCEPTQLRVITQAKGIMQIKIICPGLASHGSRPWLGHNALELLCQHITNFKSHFPTPTSPTRQTTFNFSQLSAGHVINQTPDQAEVLLDVRFHPTQSPDELTTLLRSFFPNCHLTIPKLESPIMTDPHNPFAQQLSAHRTLGFDHGSSDARHCTALGIPAVVFGPIGHNLHSDTEWVDILSISKFQQAIELFIRNC